MSDDGCSGDSLTWVLNDGVLPIAENGEVHNADNLLVDTREVRLGVLACDQPLLTIASGLQGNDGGDRGEQVVATAVVGVVEVVMVVHLECDG